MEPDHLDVEPLSEGPVYNSAAGRRKSVFTESYDPEEDEDDAKPVSGDGNQINEQTLPWMTDEYRVRHQT